MADTAVQTQFESSARESLLDVVLDRVAKSGKTSIISRLVYVGKLTKREASCDGIKANFLKVFDKFSSDGDVTGLLLLYPFCYIHVIEAKSSTIFGVLRDLLGANADVLKLSETRVISSTEDVPSRLFSNWYAAYLPSASTVENMDPQDSAGAIKTATDINLLLRKVGPALISPTELETRKRLTSMESFFDDIPAAEIVLSLCPTEDAPTLEEYLDIFDSPVNVDLESEQVWPMPPPLRY